MTAQRLQRRRAKGFRLPPEAVCVTRPGKWGNPFRAGIFKGYGAADAVRDFRAWLLGEETLAHCTGKPPTVDDIRRELRGKPLACYCNSRSPCHADVLLEIANS